MKRFVLLVVFTLAAAASVAGAANAPDNGGRGRHYGAAYFAVLCTFSHRNQDDPIVFPRQRGRSHDHTYFGNSSTNANSTPASLRTTGETSCGADADRSAYWAPTLFVANKAVEPRYAVAYYIRRTTTAVQAFPAGLKIIAGNSAARSPQSQRVTYWSCGRRAVLSSTIPTCEFSSLRLTVNFPSCWDGSNLDSANHQSHMAYPTDGACPASHPVAVPGLTIQIHYGIAGGANAELSSGGDFSGHADFVNAWDQATLARLVDRYLNRFGRRR